MSSTANVRKTTPPGWHQDGLSCQGGLLHDSIVNWRRVKSQEKQGPSQEPICSAESLDTGSRGLGNSSTALTLEAVPANRNRLWLEALVEPISNVCSP